MTPTVKNAILVISFDNCQADLIWYFNMDKTSHNQLCLQTAIRNFRTFQNISAFPKYLNFQHISHSENIWKFIICLQIYFSKLPENMNRTTYLLFANLHLILILNLEYEFHDHWKVSKNLGMAREKIWWFVEPRSRLKIIFLWSSCRLYKICITQPNTTNFFITFAVTI